MPSPCRNKRRTPRICAPELPPSFQPRFPCESPERTAPECPRASSSRPDFPPVGFFSKQNLARRDKRNAGRKCRPNTTPPTPSRRCAPAFFRLVRGIFPALSRGCVLFQPLAVVRVLVHQNKELVVRVAPIPQIIGEIFQKVLLSRIGALDFVFMPLESDFRQETQKKFPRRRLLQKKHKPTHSNGSINLSIRHSRPIISPRSIRRRIRSSSPAQRIFVTPSRFSSKKTSSGAAAFSSS